MSTSESRPAFEQQTVRALAARAAFWGSNEGLMRVIEQHPEWDGVLATAIRIAEGLRVELWAELAACGWVEDDDASRTWYAAVELEQPAPEPAPGSVAYTLTRKQIRVFWRDAAGVEQGARLYPRTDKGRAAAERCIARKVAEGYRADGEQQPGDTLSELIQLARAPRLVEDAPALAELAAARAAGEGYCVRGGCGQPATAIIARGPDLAAYCAAHAEDILDEPPAELRPLVEAFARAWDERAESLARVARALAPEPLVDRLPAGCRVRVTFGPDAGRAGTVVSGPDAGGYYSVKVDGRPADDWGGLWYYLPSEITLTTTPPAEDRPWANDDAYAAEGRRIG